jgi:hypothetical protein
MENMQYKQLKDQISRDLTPVQALAPTWKRACALFAVWALLILLVLFLFGIRPDSENLGPWLLWTLPLIQLLSAYAIVAVSIRWTIPGSAVPSSVLVGITLLGAAIHLAVSWFMFYLSPIGVEPDESTHAFTVCLVITLLLSLLPLITALVLSARGLPSRPAVLGLVFGFGCGLSAEAVWRLHCPYNSWNHILLSHTGAIIAAGLLGFVLSSLYFRRRNRK